MGIEQLATRFFQLISNMGTPEANTPRRLLRFTRGTTETLIGSRLSPLSLARVTRSAVKTVITICKRFVWMIAYMGLDRLYQQYRSKGSKEVILCS